MQKYEKKLITEYETLNSTSPKNYYSFQNIVEKIRACPTIKQHQEKIRACQEEEEQKRLKTKSSIFVLAWLPKGTKEAANVKQHSGIIAIDIDNKPQGETWEGLKDKLKKDKEVQALAVCESIRGKIRAFYNVNIHHTAFTKEQHEAAYIWISDYMKRVYRLSLDATSNINRLWFFSHDPNIYVNWQAKPVQTVKQPKEAPTTKQAAPAPASLQPTPTAPEGKLENEAELRLYIEDTITAAKQGEKHATLLRVANLVGGYLEGEGLSELEYTSLLSEAIQQHELTDPNQHFKTIQDALKNGRTQPLKFAPRDTLHPFPIHILPQQAQSILKHYQSVFRTPLDYWGAAFLNASSLAIGTGAILHQGGYENSPLFWFLLIGHSSKGKSEPERQFYKPFQLLDKQDHERYKLEKKDHEKTIAALKKGDKKPTAPAIEMQYILKDFTPEAIAKYHNVNTKGIGIIKDEFRGYLQSIGRYNKSGEVEQLIETWSGGAYVVNRATTDSIRIDSPFISLYGGIQPDLLPELAKNGRDVSGFLHRFLFVYPEDYNKPAYKDTEVSETHRKTYYNYIHSLIKQYRKQPDPREFILSPEAKQVYADFYNTNARKQEKLQKKDPRISEYLGKQDVYVLRFALLLHCISNPYTDNVKGEISKQCMEGAVLLSEYYSSFATKTIQNIGSGFGIHNKKEVAEMLRQAGKTQKDIASVLGISQQAVNKILKK